MHQTQAIQCAKMTITKPNLMSITEECGRLDRRSMRLKMAEALMKRSSLTSRSSRTTRRMRRFETLSLLVRFPRSSKGTQDSESVRNPASKRVSE